MLARVHGAGNNGTDHYRWNVSLVFLVLHSVPKGIPSVQLRITGVPWYCTATAFAVVVPILINPIEFSLKIFGLAND